MKGNLGIVLHCEYAMRCGPQPSYLTLVRCSIRQSDATIHRGARMTAQAHSTPHDEARLAHFPVSFFATVMGLAGLTLAWHKAVGVLHIVDHRIPQGLAALTGAVFVTLLALYVAKVVSHRAHVVAEFQHPVRLHFVPTISISTLLLSIVAHAVWPAAAYPLFVIGGALHFLLTLFVLNSWINRDHYQVGHLNPAWFIPIVGNVLVPLTGVPLGYVELSWFFFSIGIVFWLLLFSIILNRVLFHHPIPERLAPTLFILIAPPAVGFLSYVRLTGSIDGSARVLYYFALFLTLFLATQVPRLMRAQFFLSWWAYSFPLAAITIASLTMFERTGDAAIQTIAIVLLAITTAAIGGLFVRTLVAVSRHEICRPE